MVTSHKRPLGRCRSRSRCSCTDRIKRGSSTIITRERSQLLQKLLHQSVVCWPHEWLKAVGNQAYIRSVTCTNGIPECFGVSLSPLQLRCSSEALASTCIAPRKSRVHFGLHSLDRKCQCRVTMPNKRTHNGMRGINPRGLPRRCTKDFHIEPDPKYVEAFAQENLHGFMQYEKAIYARAVQEST